MVDSEGNIAVAKRCAGSISSKGDKADFDSVHGSKDIAKAQVFTWAGKTCVTAVSPLLVPKRLNEGWLLCSAAIPPRETADLGLASVHQL